MRKVIVFIYFLLFYSCSQEGLIFVKNLKRLNFNPLNQLLLDTGIVTNKVTIREDSKPEQIEKKELPTAKKIPIENKILNISANSVFTIKLPSETNFVVLKSIEGDTTFNSNTSKTGAGIYSFSAGIKDSKIKFDIFALEGKLIKKVAYYVNIIRETNILTEKKTEIREKIIETNIQTNIVERKTALGIKGVIENIKRDLPYSEAVKEYEKMIASEELNDEEKDIVRNELVELLLQRKNFDRAERVIRDIKNEGRKLLYTGQLNYLRKKEKEAYIFYREALSKGDDETKKKTILFLLELLKGSKLATLEEIKELEKALSGFKQDKSFYAKSMIDVAEIYIYFRKVYQSEQILKSVIEGDYDKDLRERAERVYKELKEGFIDYR